MSELIQYLSNGSHSVIIGGPNPSAEELKKRIEDLKYVFVKFVNTRGGTDLGILIDRSNCDLSNANFELSNGTVHIEGTLTLDYVKIRCVADISLETLGGVGYLLIPEEINV